MASLSAIKKLTITSDTSGLVKGAKDVENYRQEVAKAGRESAKPITAKADTSSLSKSARDVDHYRQAVEKAQREFEKGFRPDSMATGAFERMALSQRDLAQMTRSITAEMKPFSAEVRKAHAETMKAVEAENKRTLGLERMSEKLRMSYDTGYANATKYAGVERDVQSSIEARNLTVEQGNVVLAGAAVRFRQMGQQSEAANQNVRLTSNQVQNLGYQVNDVATMLLMGASPFQIIASQGGQVVQALGDGPRGVGGSLRAIGSGIASFARAIPTAAYAVAGVSAAVGGLYALTRGPQARSAEESVASFESAVRSLEGAWSGAGAAAEEHYRRASSSAASNPIDALLDSQAEVRKLQEDFRLAVRDLNWDEGLPEQILRARTNLTPLHREIREMYGDLMRGEVTAGQMADRMREIRLDEDAPGYVRYFADSIRIALGNAIDLESRIAAIGAATEALSGKGARVFGSLDQSAPFNLEDRFGGISSFMGRFDPAGMDAIRNGLRAQSEELLNANKAADDYAKALEDQRRSMAETVASLELQIDTFGQSEGAIAAAEHKAVDFETAMKEAAR